MPTRKQLTRIHPLSAAKVVSLLYCGAGLIAALVLAVAPEAAPPSLGEFPRGSLIFLPFVNAAAGFVGGLLLAAFYNLIASTIGGIVYEVADEPRPEEQRLGP